MYVESIAPEEIEKMPRAVFPGEICVIDSLGKEFDAACRYLSSKKVIGFDTESRPCFSPGQQPYGVSLLQLSGEKRAFLFRLKKIGLPKKLCSILADPDVKKVGAAVADDFRGLQKIARFEPGGVVDLQKIVGDYGIRDKSVKKMAAWEAESLSDSQRQYAATDAWICREMYLTLNSNSKQIVDNE